MPAKYRLKVVLYWHMHQPEYRNLATQEYQLPWSYLHGIKDYVDMAAHLEAVSEARAVVNFAPVLLEQIDDYAQQIQRHFDADEPLRDHLLRALVNESAPHQDAVRKELIKNCLRANEQHLIGRFPHYQKLADLARLLASNKVLITYLNDQYFADLLVWHHLAWMGEYVRRGDLRIKRLIDKGEAYSLHDRRELLHVIGELMASIIPRYAKLAKTGQVELSMTPYAHPIMPLMLDIGSARAAWSDVILPELRKYPDGEARVRRHLKQGVQTFEHYFGFRPAGCWPSEGSLSNATLKVLSEFGFRWSASGGNVLHNSLRKSGLMSEKNAASCVNRPYRLKGTETACFFRDDGLSDLVGFTYSTWHADDAVANMTHHLENIARETANSPGRVLAIILDGENAWEHYPENGYYFLDALYRTLGSHPDFELTTFSECLDSTVPVAELPTLVAGSWVYGNFSTWIGDPDKNRGWDMLGEAKKSYDSVVQSGRLTPEQLNKAEQQLFICEGSDWFWWFGDYNDSASVSDFERLYRLHLTNLYTFIGISPPDYLSQTFTHGGGQPAMGGAMRPGQQAG